MCGIVGVFTPDTEFPEAILTMMRDRIAHRGPDGAGNWFKRSESGTVALAHRRLAILDTRTIAQQPMISADGQTVIAFNGEIYNYIELRQTLSALGRTFQTKGDTEVLLQAYEEWGEDCIHRLNGMFAFVIWDGRRQQALVVRDRFGEKPIFYAQAQTGGLVIASEMKALFAWDNILCDVDFQQVNRVQNGILLHGRAETLFQNIQRFLPAHFMWVNHNGTIDSYQRYWTPDYNAVNNQLSDVQLIEEFRERLFNSVRLRTRSDVRGAACLSGGLDSSTLVGMLTQVREPSGFQLDRALSARFDDDPTIDEGSYIDSVLSHVDLPGEAITPTAAGLVGEARRLHWHHEENILSTSMYLEWCVMQRAQKLGYPVMIDGQGADEILGGYQYYFQYFQHDAFVKKQQWKLRWNTQLYALRLWLASQKYVNSQRRFSRSPGKTYRELKERGNLPYADPTKYPEAPGLPTLQPGNSFRYTLASGTLYDSLPSQLHSGDRNAMAHGVECRYPFLDYDLVDWCIKLPTRALIHRGWQKDILRRAAYGVTPNRVRWRADKVGYSGPQDNWVRQELSNWVSERIFDPVLTKIEGYSADTLQGWWTLHQEGSADYSTLLWQWASMAEWLDMGTHNIWREGYS